MITMFNLGAKESIEQEQGYSIFRRHGFFGKDGQASKISTH
jgi:hypothetical protein